MKKAWKMKMTMINDYDDNDDYDDDDNVKDVCNWFFLQVPELVEGRDLVWKMC